jgi:hypothetical protein
MRWLLILSLCACHKPKPPSTEAAVAVEGVKDQAFRDLQNDVQLLRAQLMMVSTAANAAGATQPNAAAVPRGRAQAALYTCDRLAIAQKQLAEDARAQALLGEADALCAYRAPLLLVDEKLSALDGSADAPKSECLAVRDLFGRVGQKYKNDAQVVAAQARFKIGCPKIKLVVHVERSSFSSSAPTGPDPRAQRDACKKRCDDAAFDCRSRCQYCGSCTTDKTWDWCNATCNSCRQGCEQNERFCQSSCGS